METKNTQLIEHMFKAGAHFGYSRSCRHPSTKPYIFGIKNRLEIFDLEKTADKLVVAKQFLFSLGAEGKRVIFVGTKNEAREALEREASAVAMPHVSLRWIGGSLTNFPEIRRRIDKYEDLMSKREKGELTKYTKKERLMIDREIAKLEKTFLGIVSLKEMPAAMVVVDPGKEEIAVAEAKKNHVPIVAICGSDCDLKSVEYPVPANDSSKSSIEFLIKELANAYKEGVAKKVAAKPIV